MYEWNESAKRKQKIILSILEILAISQVILHLYIGSLGFVVAFVILALLTPVGAYYNWQYNDCKKRLAELEKGGPYPGENT